MNVRAISPDSCDWNDSLTGEFCWSSVNTREAVPDVMTPSTWSLWQIYYVETNPVKLPAAYPFCGNATQRLKTGDRVRVDGGQGLVEVVA